MPETPKSNEGIDARRDRTERGRTLAAVAVLVVGAAVANVVASVLVIQVTALVGGEVLSFGLELVAVELSFLVVGLAAVRYGSAVPIPVRPPTRSEALTGAVGTAVGLLVVTLSYAITDAIVPGIELSPGFAEYTGYDATLSAALVLGAALSLMLVAPVEEFFFRGVIQGRLRSSFGPVAAIGVAGLVFAFFHVYPVLALSPPTAAIVHMTAYYTVMGALFGVAYERTNTLVVPAVIHGSFNAILFLTLVPLA